MPHDSSCYSASGQESKACLFLPFVPLVLFGIFMVVLIGFFFGVIIYTFITQDQTFADYLISKLPSALQDLVFRIIHYTEFIAELLGIDLDVTSLDDALPPIWPFAAATEGRACSSAEATRRSVVPKNRIHQFAMQTGIYDEHPSSIPSTVKIESMHDPAHTSLTDPKLSTFERVSEPEMDGAVYRVTTMASLSEPSQRIPKNLFFMIPSNESYVTKMDLMCAKQNISLIKSDNPDYHVTVFDQELADAYMKTHAIPSLLEVYERAEDSYVKYSLLRHFVIFREGGVFMEPSTQLSKPLSMLIKSDDEFLLFSHTTSSLKNARGKSEPFSIYTSRVLISTPGHIYLTTFLPVMIRIVSEAQRRSSQTLPEILRSVVYNSDSSYSDKFWSFIKVMKSRVSLLGDLGRSGVVGDILFTQVVAPLAAGARFGLKDALVDRPRHRFFGGLHDVESSIFVPRPPKINPKIQLAKNLFMRSTYAS